MLRYQNLLIGHGLLILVVALLAGFMLGFGLVGGLETAPGSGEFMRVPFYYGSSEGWARAHTGGITNGLMLLALALVMPHLFGDQIPLRRVFPYGLIFIGWANTSLTCSECGGQSRAVLRHNRFGAADAAWRGLAMGRRASPPCSALGFWHGGLVASLVGARLSAFNLALTSGPSRAAAPAARKNQTARACAPHWHSRCC